MKAAEFIADKGWDWAKKLTIKHENCYMPKTFNYWSNKLQDFVLCTKYASFEMSELKQYVDAWELVDQFGDIGQAKAYLPELDNDVPWNVKGRELRFFKWQLEEAIALVEEVESLKEVS